MRIAESFINWMIEHGANEDDRDVYIYGFECFVNELLADVLLLTVGLMTSQLLATILWLFFFTLIRTQLGGFQYLLSLKLHLSSMRIILSLKAGLRLSAEMLL